MGILPHLLFDLDGTLVDSATTLVDVMNEMLRDRGSERAVSLADARPFLSHGGPALVSGLLGGECGTLADELADFRERYAGRRTGIDNLFPGVHEGLRELHGLGFTMAVCSNKPQHLCEKILADVGLASLFDAIVGSTAAHRPKPDPDLMELTLNLLRCSPRRAILIGDSEVDHAFAVQSGVRFVFVDYGYASDDWHFAGPDRFSHFADVVAWLRNSHSSTTALRRVA